MSSRFNDEFLCQPRDDQVRFRNDDAVNPPGMITLQRTKSSSPPFEIPEAMIRVLSAASAREAGVFSIDLALLTGHEKLGHPERALPIATALSERAPGSQYAFSARWNQLRALQRFQEADELALKRLKERPEDLAALRSLEQNSAAQHDYASAYERGLKILASGHSDASDLNELA